MYKKHREDGRRGGGCVIYVSKELKSYTCSQMRNIQGDDSVWCWVKLNERTRILVGCIYRSPNCSNNNNELIMNQIMKASEVAGENRMLLMGDFNVKEIDWTEDEVIGSENSFPFRFNECIKDCFLYQHVQIPTRYKGTQPESLLDLVFTKEEQDVKNIQLADPLGKSDHGVIICDFICVWMPANTFIPKRLYHKADFELINQLLSEVNWEHEFQDKNMHQKWEYFKTKLEEILMQHVPMSEPRKYKAPWVNRKVRRAYRNKHMSWLRYLENKRGSRWREYVKDRQKVEKIERQEKRAYEKKLAKEIGLNRRVFFKYVNSKLTVRPEISSLLNENGEVTNDEKEMCNISNRYFHSAFNQTTNDDELPEMEQLCDENISEIVITPEMVKARLETLNKFKSCGPDNEHPHVLKETAASICVPLSVIFNDSLRSGETPSDWRKANVTPIFKKGDRNNPANYRPVSLTSQVCKVMESIVRGKIVDHLNEHNLLSERQHGFREGRSCLSNLLTTLEEWTNILDGADCVDVAYLDFSKAFDLVSHKHLLLKLEKYGINGDIGRWIQAFLENRKQKVVIRGNESEELDVLSGVPQGSVLGPILFLIFINDLPDCTTCPVCLFADDSKVYNRVPRETNGKPELANAHNNLQEDLQRLHEWATKWKMSFNVNKCKVMHIGYDNPNHQYNLNGEVLASTTEEKDLGIVIDNELKFAKHIKGIVGKANRMIGLIKISFGTLDDEMFSNLYNTLIRPLLEYCVLLRAKQSVTQDY